TDGANEVRLVYPRGKMINGLKQAISQTTVNSQIKIAYYVLAYLEDVIARPDYPTQRAMLAGNMASLIVDSLVPNPTDSPHSAATHFLDELKHLTTPHGIKKFTAEAETVRNAPPTDPTRARLGLLLACGNNYRILTNANLYETSANGMI